MWRFSGKIFSPQWQKARQTTTKCHAKSVKKKTSLCIIPDYEKNSHDDSKEKQHANKQQHKFSDDPQFRSHALCSTLLETAAWTGAAALYLDMQHKLYVKKRHVDKKCFFSNLVFNMPKKSDAAINRNILEDMDFHKELSRNKEKIICDAKTLPPNKVESGNVDTIFNEINEMTIKSISSVENSIGTMLMSHDKSQAFEFFKASAQLKCPKGIFNLAMCYETGCGTNIDLRKAVQYYEEAASLHHSLATYNLAVYTMKGLGGVQHDTQKGLKLLQKAADSGVVKAQVCLGAHHLENGDHESAFKMFKVAASQNLDAKYHLGLCYENGWGVAENTIIAGELFAEAAKLGHEDATLKLGNFFERGCEGIDADEDFSRTLYHMLAERGHKGGKDALQSLKQKQVSKWKIFRYAPKNEPPKPSTTIHTSSSEPQLQQYETKNHLEHSKSCSLLFFSSYLSPIRSSSKTLSVHMESDDAKYSLDLATNMSLMPVLPRVVATNS